MTKKTKKNKKKFGIKLEDDIRNIFKENPKSELNYKQVAGFLDITDKVLRKLVYETLQDLSESGYLKQTQRGKFRKGKQNQLIEGVIEVSKRGKGFVITNQLDQDVMIPARYLDGVLHGDRVSVELKTSKRANRTEGRIVEVLDRDQRRFVGTLEQDRKHAFFIPDDFKMNADFYIPAGKMKGAVSGEKVIVKVTDWPESAKSPFAEVVEVLGSVESNDVQMRSILAANDIKSDFPEEVIRQADLIDMKLDPEEIEKRRDFRETLTFTIDPIDAKDFDDAISVEQLSENLVRIGVHIADVSHYVLPGSVLDVEARERGNSVYLVDRVIPMLPEHLSNGVCSLRPNEEKFVFSAVFDLTPEGQIKNEWFGKGVINSDRRFTYEEAQEVIETGKGDFAKEINQCDQIAKKLRSERLGKGGLEIVSSEIRFELDEKGMPINVYKKTSKDANKLIEEFMLLANKRVGRFVGDVKKGKKPVPLVYRIHDKPDKEKVEQFSVFVSKFGHQFRFKNDHDIAVQMNNLFHKMKDDGNFNMIQQMAIKSMAKAVYDTENIGHYGLGFDYYAHFTSPIRRYADLLVHRILFGVLNGDRKAYPELRDIADHISATERKAVDAERASKKYFQAQYLSDQIGDEFTGFITGITDWGMFVEMHENHCEGMVPLKSIRYDQFYFDEGEYALIGKRTGESFTVGDEVKVRLSRVSLVKKQIDLELLE
jgi:ribonuclease R